MNAPTRPGGARPAGWRWRWRSSPLRRPCDAVEAWIRLVMLTVLLVAVPLAGALCGVAAYDSGHAKAEALRSAHHVVRATVVRDAPNPAAASYGTGRTEYPVAVRWRDADGTRREAEVKVAAGTRAGSRADVWLDPAGRVVAAPGARTSCRRWPSAPAGPSRSAAGS
ncbi:hypothetical protein SSPIM334S_01666 [Streptomyces spiroverticillatus]